MGNRIRKGALVIFILLLAGTLFAEESGNVKQPGFIENGGMLRENEHAVLTYIDAAIYPVPIMVGYRYGIFFWWDIGIDVGGDYWGPEKEVGQVLFHTKMEYFKTKDTEFFFWAQRFQTGYKWNRGIFKEPGPDVPIEEALIFEDNSWILNIENSFAFRVGELRNHAIVLNTQIYFDFDLSPNNYATDYYFSPLILGYEWSIDDHFNFFLQAGATWTWSGMDTSYGILYEDDWFPVGKIGFGWRTGDMTAKY